MLSTVHVLFPAIKISQATYLLPFLAYFLFFFPPLVLLHFILGGKLIHKIYNVKLKRFGFGICFYCALFSCMFTETAKLVSSYIPIVY